jgi:3'-phosphoadenosine 5'-phosphosulfate sulfotransferase (PAPS reductase)/FAD synthetase
MSTSIVLLDSQVEQYLHANAVIAIGVSGGKDSDATAILTTQHLDRIGHRGERLLIHADLGEIEHADSLPQCQRLAAFLGLPLVVVRRRQGGMIERWEQRWRDNLQRYVSLQCVTLITPWSSASLRFCTSELKVAPITAELGKRFKGRPIVNVIGIRREESPTRALKPVSQVNKKLTKTDGTTGIDWHPILHLLVEDVFAVHHQFGFAAHEAYSVNGNSRVSCSVCVLSSLHDLQASLRDKRNHVAYRRVVALEFASGFSFQPSRWLADVRPDLLTAEQQTQLPHIKTQHADRRRIESQIPREMLFVQGWPTFIPSIDQCKVLARVRRQVGKLLGLSLNYLTASQVQARYRELFLAREKRPFRQSSTPTIAT